MSSNKSSNFSRSRNKPAPGETDRFNNSNNGFSTSWHRLREDWTRVFSPNLDFHLTNSKVKRRVVSKCCYPEANENRDWTCVFSLNQTNTELKGPMSRSVYMLWSWIANPSKQIQRRWSVKTDTACFLSWTKNESVLAFVAVEVASVKRESTTECFQYVKRSSTSKNWTRSVPAESSRTGIFYLGAGTSKIWSRIWSRIWSHQAAGRVFLQQKSIEKKQTV